METIEHSLLHINGLNLHVAHVGKGEKGAVVFLHGFPEIWYTWRHQMVAVAEAGYRAIAPDFRGYGLSDEPKEVENAKWEDIIDDLVAILDSLQIPKAFMVGKDFGAKPVYDFALRHPDRVSGLITLGVPFSPPLQLQLLPEGFYIWRWREPGRAEADFGRFDVKTVIRNVYILFSSSEIPIAAEGQEIMDLVDPSTPLPSWFSEEDLKAYADLYEKSRFKFPLQMPYRLIHEFSEPITNPKVEAPALFIMGEKDYCLKFPGMEDYVRSETAKQHVPNLDVVFVPGGSHFIHEQFPDKINALIVEFLNSHN